MEENTVSKGTTMHLYELTNTMIDLVEMLDQADPNEIDQSVDQAFEDLDQQVDEKMNNLVKVIKEFEAMAAARKAEAKAMNERAQHAQRAADRIKAYLKFHLERLEPETKRRQVGPFAVAVVRNGGKQPIEIREEDVPMEWKVATYKPNTDLIRKHLEQGDPLGFAQLLPRSDRLQIR